MAVLSIVGKEPSERERLMILVMGTMSESIQDLRRRAGIISREQVASEEERIADLTSSVVAGQKWESKGGVGGNDGGDEAVDDGNVEQSLVILSSKN